MSEEEKEKKIELFEAKRACDANFDTSQLALQDVKQTNNHYSRKINMIQDADIKVTWSSEDVEKYFGDFLTGEQKEIFKPTEARVVTYSLGLLFRYRMDWESKGYGLGELLHSISLLPNEELTLEFKTWETDKRMEQQDTTLESKNTSDVESTQSDVKEVLDDFNSKENFEFSAHAEASWGWGSAEADTKYSTEAAEQHKTVTKTARGGVQKALNSLAQKRSMKIAISRESGSESKSTRKIKNINQCHTLNVNYYQLLRQYMVSMYLYDVQMVLFGNYFSSGELKMIFVGTIYPYQIIEPPSREVLIDSLLSYSLDKNPYKFQNKILRHCTPRPDINDPDLKGRRRYAFMITLGPFEDRDNDGFAEYPIGLEQLLDYLYGFYTKDSPPPEMAGISVVKEKVSSAEVALRTEIVVPMFHFLQRVETAEFTERVKSVKETIIDQFIEARKNLTPELLIDSWPVVIPTYGVYAETMLGKCSGCEDYFDIQRQFDLELKKLEVEKLKLEVEKLKILNQRTEQAPPGSNITIKNPPEKSTLQLNVDVTPGEESTSVSFGKEKS